MGDKSSRQMMSPKVHVPHPQVQLLQGFSALKKNPKQSQKRYMVSAAVPSGSGSASIISYISCF